MSDGNTPGGTQDQQNAGGNGGNGAEPPKIPEGYLSQEQVNATVQDRLNRDRRARLTDPEYRKQAFDAWRGDDSVKDEIAQVFGFSKGKPGPDELESFKQSWHKQEVEPRESQIKTLSDENQSLRRDSLRRKILESASGIGVKRYAQTPVSDEAPPVIVSMMEGAFAFDPETREWYVKKGDGFEYSKRPGRVYMTVDEFMESWAATPAAKDLLEPRMRDGAGFKGITGNRGVTLEEFDAMSPQDRSKLYRENPELYTQLMGARQAKGEAALKR